MTQKTGFFSLQRNLAVLFNPQPGQLRPIDGLRALSILLVLVFHSFWFLPLFDKSAVEAFYQSSPWLNWVYNGELGVDIFFVISGFLISTLLMKEYQENNNVRFLRFYQRRFLRLMPAYLIAIACGLLMLPENTAYVWTNLLYINNLMPAETHFMPWTWSLAIEEQFYFLYPLLLVLALRFVSAKRLVYLAALLYLGSYVIRYGVIKHYDFSLPYCWYPDTCEGFFRVIDYIYVKPWTRFGSFLPGIFAAYLYVYHGDKVREVFAQHSKRMNFLALLSLTVTLMILFVPVNNQHAVFAEGLGDIYYAAYRNLFTTAIGFLMLYSLYATGSVGGFAAKVLSVRVLYPIGQLAYSSYLFHPFIFVVSYGVIFQTAPELSVWSKVAIVAAVGIPLTLLLAMVIYLLVERPFMNMRGLLRNREPLMNSILSQRRL